MAMGIRMGMGMGMAMRMGMCMWMGMGVDVGMMGNGAIWGCHRRRSMCRAIAAIFAIDVDVNWRLHKWPSGASQRCCCGTTR